MTSITIHNLDSELQTRIKEQAMVQGLSLNKTIKNLLRKSLGITRKGEKKSDFSRFCGVWSDKEFKEFEKNTQQFEVIDEEEWK